MTERSAGDRIVLVCLSRSCKRQGAVSVLEAFQQRQTNCWTVRSSTCMGQCGNGVMVRVLPDDVWYWQVQAVEVSAIVESHLHHGCPISKMLCPAMHSGSDTVVH